MSPHPGPSDPPVSPRLGHAAALTCPRHVIHYRVAASLPSRGKAFEESVWCEKLEAELVLVDPKKNAGYDVDKKIAEFVKAIS